MRAFLAYSVCRIASFLLKLVKRGGSLPGELARKVDKNILKKLKYPQDIILVTATNGKTSTTNLIAEVLKNAGKKVIYNHKGDNLIKGITTLFLTNATLGLRIKADVVVIEIDEITLAKYKHEIPANYILINNFFRDQLDRSGEMETVIANIEKALVDYNHTLILNQDDPNVYRIALKTPKAKVITYHLDQNATSALISKEASEGKFCPECHGKIVYEYYQYSHIGKYRCPNCGFGNQAAEIEGKTIDAISGTFYVDDKVYQPTINGLYHIYNCLACITLTKQLEIAYPIVANTIHTFELAMGRNETILLNEKKCVLNLVKNPTGCNEILKTINKSSAKKTLLFVLNDNEQDSRDVSWIWDVDFEMLENVEEIICAGTRANEIALRIKYGFINTKITVFSTVREAVNYLASAENELYALATYTALPKVRKEIYIWS